MIYILIAVLSVVFIFLILCFSAWRISLELVVPPEKKDGLKNKFPHEKRFKIQSPNGYPISCLFIPTGDGMSMTEKIVIILHQFGSDKNEASKYADIFTSLGFSVLIPDMRAHGESGGDTSSMGFYEKKDVEAIVRWLKDCYGRDVFYGIFGLADGGCTALMYASEDQGVRFVIADSSFGDLKKLYKYTFKNRYKVKPFPLLNFTSLFIKKRAGFLVKDVRPISFFSQKNSTHDFPLMLIHGDCDKQVPPNLSVDIYNMKNEGVKTLYLAPGCGHLEAFDKENSVYTEKIHNFIKENIND